MAVEENKALIRRYFEDAPHNPAVCDEIFAENLHWHALYHTAHPDFVSSPQAEKEAYARHRQVWGDWTETINIMMAEGDRVMVHWVGKGVQAGEYMGIPATNRMVSLSGVYLFRITDGKIVEVWNLWDRLGELQQMGILPETREIIAKARERMAGEELSPGR
jgi:predicted ester cyclase